MAMTRDDIIRMAREAGLEEMWDLSPRFVGLLERFVNLVAAAEREACAKVTEDGRFLHDDSPEARFGKACARAIRARGQ